MASLNPNAPDVYETVSNSNIVELEAVIGCISAVIGLLILFLAAVKLYYGLNFHCKAKPSDIKVTVLSENQAAGNKMACITWNDPQRSIFQTFMCMIVNYKIFCSGDCQCGAEKILHFLEKDKAKIELQEYLEHKLQVSICYTGKVIQAAHWCQPSDSCVVHAPPSRPTISEVRLSKNKVPTFFFQPPKFPNGDIVEYVLSCRIDGQPEGREFQIVHSQVQQYLFAATLHVPLQPLVNYVFRLAALSFRNKVEFHGEWSEDFRFNVPVEGIPDQTSSWSPGEWRILEIAIVDKIGSDIFSLMSVLGFTESEKDNLMLVESGKQGNFEDIAMNVLTFWKRKFGTRTSLRVLHKHLTGTDLISLAENLKNCSEREGIHL